MNDSINETGQTGQEVTDDNGEPNEPNERGEFFFEVAQDTSGRWHWQLWSGNGRPMARNATSYGKRHDCTEAIKQLRVAISDKTPILVATEPKPDIPPAPADKA